MIGRATWVPEASTARSERAATAARKVVGEGWYRALTSCENATLRRLAAAIAIAAVTEEIMPERRSVRLRAELIESASRRAA